MVVKPDTCLIKFKVKNRADVFEGVRHVLCQVLGAKKDEVTLTARISDDLGAESIDYLDIVFRLEKVFALRIRRGEIMPGSIFSNPEFVRDGVVNAAGITELKRLMPYLNLSVFLKNPVVAKFSDIYTVQALVDFVSGRLGL